MRYEYADLIVVGGGLLGAWVAWSAQKAGIATLLVEQSRPGKTEGATTQTAAPLGPFHGRPFLKESLSAYKELFTLTTQDYLSIGARERVEVLDGYPLEPKQLKERHPQIRPTSEVWGLESQAFMADFPHIQYKVWEAALKAGVKCFTDTHVQKLDLEYERPTAVCRGVALRGKSLICAAGQGSEFLLGALQGLVHWPQQRDFYDLLPVTPTETPKLPNVEVLFKVPVYLEIQPDSFSLHRNGLGMAKALEEPLPTREETAALLEFKRKWLPNYGKATGGSVEVIQQGRDELPLIGAHAWRNDVIVMAGLGPWGNWMAPGASRLAIALLKGQEESPYALGRKSLQDAEVCSS